ncbi:MAG TPA: ATP-binding protein [Candidatus Limnocylindrales bacterium]|nr:ATP-binding protein [Candidatus Limnocylindrales bacterium]
MSADPRAEPARIAIAGIAIAALAFAAGLSATAGRYDTGIRFSVEDSKVVVSEVEHLSPAERDGIRPGMVAVSINGWQLIQLPEPQYADPDPNNPDAPPVVTGWVPATPAPIPDVARSIPFAYLLGDIGSVDLAWPEDLAGATAENPHATGFFYPGADRFDENRMAIVPGIIVLIAGAWWLRTGAGGAALASLAVPLAVAAATPFLVLPLAANGTFSSMVLAWLITIAAQLPLAAGLIERSAVRDRSVIWAGVGAFVIGSVAVVAGAGLSDGSDSTRGTLRWLLVGSIALLPGLAAAGPIDLDRVRGRVAKRMPALGGLLRSTELAVAGATPLFAIGTDRSPFVVPLAVWLIAIAAAARFTVRPLARVATRATLQRDLVVAAAEAERARLAADIHDDALQELTLLVRRLESSGDTEGAEIGRTVADKLRAICGDLRLPILDDLGVGPALDWLVLRIERLAGGEVRLERADDARHSPDVELAIFRVAQEALANAVKHGKPPIVVRYRSTPAGISLAVDDAGPGIADDAPETAEQTGRFGLLNMAQRAEQIGAILDVRRWPGGGTHVALEWRPR